MPNLSLSTFIFAATLGIFLVGSVLWLLLRVQWQRVWLPTLSVLDLKSTKLRKVRVQRPPWVPFAFFILTTLALVIFSTQPKLLVRQEGSGSAMHLHLFFDLSPSNAASISMSQYHERLAELWGDLGNASKISLSSTQSGQVRSVKNLAEAQEWLATQNFHRAGIDLAMAFKQQREAIGDVDGLLILSDANQASWRALNWKMLADDMHVYWVDLRSNAQELDNVFFRDIRLVSAPQDPTLEWDIELERVGTSLSEREGTLKAQLGNKVLLSLPWHLGDKENKNMLRASFAATKITQAAMSDSDEPLVWSLVLSKPDALELDNVFRTPLRGLRQDALLVGEPAGERQLEDYFYALRTVLETFGFMPTRVDHWEPSLQNKKTPILVFAIDESQDLQTTCPLSLRKTKSKNQIVWVLPQLANTSLRTLCRCAHKLSGEETASAPGCEHAVDRTAFNEIMSSWGLAPLGGKISDARGSIAWAHRPDGRSAIDLAAFSVPLRPQRQMGLDHAVFPLLMKDLLTWYRLIDDRSQIRQTYTQWPRISDLSAYAGWMDASMDAALALSNVPIVASRMFSLEDKELPPRWVQRPENAVGSDPRFQKEDLDPLLCIQLLLGGVFLLMFLEMIWNLRRRRHTQSSISLGLVVLAVLAIGQASPVHAELYVPILGRRYDASLDTITKEANLRTSLDFSESKEFVDPLKTPSEAWYWVRNLDLIRESNGTLNNDFRYWLKRGGFLVVQGLDQTGLQKLTAGAFGPDTDETHWQAIPPDHELMRSFYLIDALPSCRGQTWYGFQFDGRLAILAAPFDFLAALSDRSEHLAHCEQTLSSERKLRLFINISMLALTTDYKKDQIQVREILKRLH